MEAGAGPAEKVAPHILIQSRSSLKLQDFAELWERRELVYFLMLRDISAKYKQTLMGPLWILARPVIEMVVITIIFGRLARLPSDGIPYPLFSFSALLVWHLFQGSMNGAAQSVVSYRNIVRKVYFPRLVLPIAKGSTALVDFAWSFIILIGFMVYYYFRAGIAPNANIVFYPFYLFSALIPAYGLGLFLAALNVQFRDASNFMGLTRRLFLYATPIAYSSQIIPAKWRSLYYLNPLVTSIDGCRWSLVGANAPPHLMQIPSLLVGVAMLLVGLWFFRRSEHKFADVV